MRVFIENQKFDQWWLRLVLISVLLLAIGPMLLLNDWQDFGQNELVILLVSFAIIGAVSVFILFVFTLKSKIDDQGVHVHFYPFKRSPRLIPWDEITKIYTREYSPISEYGGWGYRVKLFKGAGAAYNVKGNIGIQMELTNGKKILIGTQKQTEADSVINYYTNKSDSYDSL
ncbi:MAG: hypothetical protein ABJM06_01690 [Gilvibacter sp.]